MQNHLVWNITGEILIRTRSYETLMIIRTQDDFIIAKKALSVATGRGDRSSSSSLRVSGCIKSCGTYHKGRRIMTRLSDGPEQLSWGRTYGQGALKYVKPWSNKSSMFQNKGYTT